MSHNLLFSTDPNHRWSPRHLQAMSYLYGLHTPDSDQATVLELGCGMGANLLPFAVAYPNAKATGIDIDGEKIAAGQLHLAQHGIKNITLYTADITSLLESELEQYDYILIRGLFAQTDLETRTALLSWCQKHLSPDGIICIGYQTYPGSKVTDSLYEAFAFHAAQSEQPEEQVAGIKAMLGFMSEGISSNNPLYQQIKPALNILEEKSDEQLYIESFAGLHNPCYFIEFANSLADTGLCYVGDADAHTEIPAHWGNDTEHLYQVINPQKNKVFGQQYLDLLCGRATRMSLLTHSSHVDDIEFEPNTEKLMDLRWAGYFERIDVGENKIISSFKLSNNEVIETQNLISQEIFDNLGWSWPFSLNYETLLTNTSQETDIIDLCQKSIEKLNKSLEAIFIQQGISIRFSLKSSPFDLTKDKNISWANRKETYIGNKNINLWHDTYKINEINIESTEIEKTTTDNYISLKKHDLENINLVINLNKLGFIQGDNKSRSSLYRNFLYMNRMNEEENSKYIIHLLFQSIPSVMGRKTFSPQIEPYNHKNLNKIKKLINEGKSEEAANICFNKKKSYYGAEDIFFSENQKRLSNYTISTTKDIITSIILAPEKELLYNSLALAYKTLFKKRNKIYPILKSLVIINPKNHYAWDALAMYFKDRNKLYTAKKLHEKAYSLYKKSPGIISNYASTCSSLGEVDLAIQLYEEMLKISSFDEFHNYSNYLFSAIHSNIYNPEKLFAIHKEYGNRVTQWAKQQNWQPTYNVNTPANHPLRIGFVSGDLREHAVTKFLLPYWENLDKNKFMIYAYHNHPTHDHMSERLKSTATQWLDVHTFTHTELAKKIYEDEINILIDLSGHTGYNRLPVFGLKPAPVQMSWIGYPATTGLEQIDYKITSAAYAKLDWMQEQFTEKLLYMDAVPVFDNTIKLPAITEQMPCEKNGYFTFASFNRPQKISDEVLKTWAEIMQSCPNDKLLIANMPDEETTTSFKEKLIGFGAKEDQLVFKKRVGLDEYMEMHNEVDLLLDTFPYNGGTTALHSISMGVATVVLAGKSMVSHPQVYYIYGLEDFLAPNIENYKAKAILWRNRSNELLELKKKTRSKFEEINFNKNEDKDYIKVFSNLLQYSWNNHLENGEASSKVISK